MKKMMQKAPMGWNSYDYYDTNVNEAQIKANADYMAKHMKAAGWEYIVVDIEWYSYYTGSKRDRYQYIPFERVEMDEWGRLFPCPEKFPSSANGQGFKPLADYVHGLGLKFGIHIMRGIPREAAHRHLPIYGSTENAMDVADPNHICKWNPDMYGVRDCKGGQDYYNSLIELYASWGVDFIKCDDICNTSMFPDNPYSAAHEIEMIARAIENCKADMVLSLSPGPALIDQAAHYEKHANMWRITDDFWDRFDLLCNMFYRCELWQNHVEPGSYPDCDMLPVGYVGKGFGEERITNFTMEEQRTMLTLWCIFGSPLMIGGELTLLDDASFKLLMNEDVLKLVENDYLGRQHERDESHAIWTNYNGVTGEKHIAFFNLSEERKELECDLREVVQFYGKPLPEKLGIELWGRENADIMQGKMRVTVEPHDAVIYRLIKD